ncbi:hypothetical protein QUB70_21595 [Microcoleus sp. A003_D6]
MQPNTTEVRAIPINTMMQSGRSPFRVVSSPTIRAIISHIIWYAIA